MTAEATDPRSGIQLAGRLGFWSLIGLAVISGIHPIGDTELYADGQRFLEHVDPFWIVIHFVAALLLLVFPIVFHVWARNLGNVRAQILGQWVVYIAIVGTTVGVIHQTATDTTAWVAFGAGGGSEAAATGTDILLRLYTATFTAWVFSFFLPLPIVIGLAAKADGRFPGWYMWLAWIAGALAMASIVVTMVDAQVTTLSDMGLFRPSAVLLLILALATTWWMRKGAVIPGGAAVGLTSR